jgi:hypothetical protein
MTIPGSRHHRVPTILTLQVDIASAGNEQLTYIHMTLTSSRYQCGPTILILQVDTASAGYKKVTYFLMTISSSLYQRGHTIHFKPLVQTSFDLFNPSALSRRYE